MVGRLESRKSNAWKAMKMLVAGALQAGAPKEKRKALETLDLIF